MTTVTDAFAALLRLAEQGSPFGYDQVYTHCEDLTAEQLSALVGRGYDLDRTVQVPDQDTDDTVPGVLSLRVVNADGPGYRDGGEGPGLIIRANLRWTTSGGNEHLSHVFYGIPVANAERLEQLPSIDNSEADALTDDPSGEGAMSALGNFLGQQWERNAVFGADWRQEYPGAMNDFCEEDDDLTALAVLAERNAPYHERAVMAVTAAEPDLACMLAPEELGALADASEIVKICTWLKDQPEVAATV